MKLTDTAIRKAKATGKTQKMPDGKGLRLEITTAGSKIFKYRFKIQEKDSDYVIGEYPAISLARARVLRDEARALVKQGINPNEQRRKQKEEEQAEASKSDQMTLKQLYDEFAVFKTTAFGDREPDWQEDTLHKHNLRFEKHVFPMLGDKPVVDVTETDLEDCLLQVQTHGTLVNRNKIKSVFNVLFKYAKAKRYVERDVAKYVSDALFIKHEAKHYKHVTTEPELRALLQKIKAIKATFEVSRCLELALYTFARPSEVAGLKWSEVNFNERLVEKEAGAMKQRRNFVIPLSQQSLKILEGLKPVTGHTEFVFYSPNGTGRPISTASLTNALRRNGIDEINPHGFRHTASTALNELGFNADEIELQLSHVIQGVRGVYNKAEKLKQRFVLMQAWADYVDRLQKNKASN